MIKNFLRILIFVIVLFFYIHINYHLKTNNDLEIYVMENPSKHHLSEICNLRQPVKFTYPDQTFRDCNISNIEEHYGVFDINIRNLKTLNEKNNIPVPLKLKQALTLFTSDNTQTYITENNESFLKESLAINLMKHGDNFLRPPLLSKCKYDYSIGSNNATTPLRYELNYKNYIYVPNGTINIKLVPPRYKKHLFTTYDYENFEFRSPLNIWDIQSDYKNQYDKIKVLDLELKEGEFLFIPPYWWYTIKFKTLTSLCYFKYQTFMNVISISPQILIHLLQKQNVKNTLVKTIKPLEDEVNHIKNSIGVEGGLGVSGSGKVDKLHADKMNIRDIISTGESISGDVNSGENIRDSSVAKMSKVDNNADVGLTTFADEISKHENLYNEINKEMSRKVNIDESVKMKSLGTTSIEHL